MIAREATSALGRLGRVVRIGGGRVAGTTLMLSIVGAPPVEAGPADPRWRGYPVEVHESDRGVEVLVREQLPDVDFPPGHGMSRMGWSILLPVHLSRPFAERVVVDLGSNLPVPVVHGLLTASPATGWTLRAEPGGSPWVQQFTGPAGHLTVAQGPVAIGTMSQPAFYEQTGVTTVRGSRPVGQRAWREITPLGRGRPRHVADVLQSRRRRTRRHRRQTRPGRLTVRPAGAKILAGRSYRLAPEDQ